MKRLILLRHGKSSWASDAPTDHQRPLAKRGIRAAETVGRFLRLSNTVPDRIISSSAVRAAATARIARESGGWDCPLDLSDELYLAHPGAIIDLVGTRDGDEDVLMLVGHEPTWSSLTSILTGGGSVRVATGTTVAIDFDVPWWRSIAPGRGHLAWLIPPRLLTDGDLDLGR